MSLNLFRSATLPNCGILEFECERSPPNIATIEFGVRRARGADMMNESYNKAPPDRRTPKLLPATAKCFVELHERKQFVAASLGQIQFGIKQIPISIERI